MSKDDKAKANRNQAARTQIANAMAKKTTARCVLEVAKRFQLMIRLIYADSAGRCECVTCGKSYHYKAMNAGHYIPRQFTEVVFLAMNCHPQCVSCNQYGSGEVAKYRQFLVKKYGESHVKDLESKRKSRKWTKEELIELKLSFNAIIRSVDPK